MILKLLLAWIGVIAIPFVGIAPVASAQETAGVLVTPDTLLPGVSNAEYNCVAFSDWARAHGAPRFEDFQVQDTAPGPPVPVRLDSRDARMYRTVLRRGAARGPNFAGHFTVVLWNNGTFVNVAVVNARTGHVYPIQFSEYPVAPMFRKNSALFVVDLAAIGGDGDHPAYPILYLKWDGSRFLKVRKLDASTVRITRCRDG